MGKSIELAWILFPLAVSIIVLDPLSPKWSVCSLFLSSIPLIMWLVRRWSMRYWALWISAFLVFQALLSPLVTNQDYITLEPDLKKVVIVESGIPGISGRQVISTDHMGFRTTARVDYSSDKPFRIFAIGASTTEEIYLDDHKTWTNLLQEKLRSYIRGRKIEVINTGVSGLRARHYFATLKKVSSLKADMALFLPGINDWNHHVIKSFMGAFGRTRLILSSMFFLKRTLLGMAGNKLRRKLFGMHEINASPETTRGEYYAKKRGSLFRPHKIEFEPNRVDTEYYYYLQKISGKCKQEHIDCIFLTQPNGYKPKSSKDFRAGFWMTPPQEDYTLTFDSLVHLARMYNSFLLSFAKNHEQWSCDLDADVPPSFDYMYDECHFNEKGAALVSSLLFECIRNRVSRAIKN
ncbi:MAG: SGNH/GDSL hydrolase family protein [Deltaproteobacteria bacterium]|nr:SGNH/GDSL hydrolase family protein [Deltaproteobacteria bacterium]